METEVWKRLDPLRPGLRERWRGLVGEGFGERTLSLGDVDRLRETEGPAVARFVSLQFELARRARARLGAEDVVFLTSKGAEQATARPVALYRAARFHGAASGAPVWDACTGIGSDLVALGRSAGRIVATDRSVASLRCALGNLALALERDGRDLRTRAVAAVADAGRPLLAVPGSALVLFDPDRRPDGDRERRAERWSPAIEDVFARTREVSGACIKLPPSATRETLAASGLPEAAECAWISLDGEMKELAVWTGALAHVRGRAAVGLRTSGIEARFEADLAPLPPAVEPSAALESGWLVELDASLWSADLAGAFAALHGLSPLAGVPKGGFLVARAPVDHGLARSFRIVAVAPGDRRKVRAMLREHGIGPVTVKTRGHRVPADRLAASFRGTGSRQGLLAVTRAGRGTVALLVESPAGSSIETSRGPEPGPARSDEGRVVGDEGLEPPTPSV